MKERVLLGLLTPFFRPIPAYAKAAAGLGVDLAVVTPKRINWSDGQVDALVWSEGAWERKTVGIPKAFYNRFYGPKPQVISRLELVIGKNRVFNHVTRFDKLIIHQALSSTQLQSHLPDASAFSPEGLRDYLKRFDEVILKPREGQLGVDIFLISKKGRQLLVHHGTKSPIASFPSQGQLLAWFAEFANEGWLIQQYIPLAQVEGRMFDVRILVQKDDIGLWQVSGAISRIALRYSYVTNLSQAIVPAEELLPRAFPELNILPKLEDAAKTAACRAEQVLGSLGEVSVDFGLDAAGKYWIIELNGKPMKSLFSILGRDYLVKTVYRRPLLYALHLQNSLP